MPSTLRIISLQREAGNSTQLAQVLEKQNMERTATPATCNKAIQQVQMGNSQLSDKCGKNPVNLRPTGSNGPKASVKETVNQPELACTVQGLYRAAMPAKLQIDREQVRLLVIQYGVRETARMLGLAEPTVQAWSARFGWIRALSEKPALPPTMIQAATSATISPADAAIKALREDLALSRLAHARSARKVAVHLCKQSPEQLMADGGEGLLKATKQAALVGDWQNQTPQRVSVCITALDDGALLDIPQTQDESSAFVIEV